MKQEETGYMEGGELAILLYLPSGTVPRTLATCLSSWIKPWKQSLQSKCWQGRNRAPTSSRSCRHTEQVCTMASIWPLPCFWSMSGSPIKLMPISVPMPVPGTGALPMISSGVKQRVERASSTPCKWSTKHGDSFLLGGECSWRTQRAGDLCPAACRPQPRTLPWAQRQSPASPLQKAKPAEVC